MARNKLSLVLYTEDFLNLPSKYVLNAVVNVMRNASQKSQEFVKKIVLEYQETEIDNNAVVNTIKR